MSRLSTQGKRYLSVTAIVLLLVFAAFVFATAAQADPPAEKCRDLRAKCLIAKYFHGPDDQALEVAQCESGYNQNAQRPGSQFIGVFQIGSRIHASRIARLGYTTDDLRDAGKNARVAWDLYSESGWGPWECKP